MSTSEPPAEPTGTMRPFSLPTFPAQDRPRRIEHFVLQPLGGPASDLPAFIVQDLTGRIEQMLAAAREQAQEMERRAYEEGFRQGQRHGRELGEKSLEPVMQRLSHLVAELETAREELHEEREKDLLRLLLLMGKKMLGRELTLRPDDLERLIREGLRQLADSERLRLAVHPQDYALLQRADRSAWPPGVELAADPNLTPGGFVLETPQGNLDGSWESRWDRLARVIEEALDSAYENRPAP